MWRRFRHGPRVEKVRVVRSARLDALLVRGWGTDLLTIRIDLDD